MKKTVLVRYFALLREQRGLGEERVETAAATAGDLYRELQARHPFTLGAARLRVAVHDAVAPWDTLLKEGDAVAFRPPVAGG